MPEKNGYALFDLDHTILPFDTQASFANFVLKREGWRRIYLLWFFAAAPLAVCRILDLRKMKRLFSSYLWGMSEEKLRAHVDDFMETDFPASLYPEVVAEIERHRSEGRVLILNSASPEFYVEKIAAKLGFDHFLGTNLIIENHMPFLPKIVGPNNKHEAKITAMQERGLLPDDFDPARGDKLPNSWAYSDSPADIPLLSIAENCVMIHPGETLSACGKENGWATLLPARPYEGKWGARFATFWQALGIWDFRTQIAEVKK